MGRGWDRRVRVRHRGNKNGRGYKGSRVRTTTFWFSRDLTIWLQTQPIFSQPQFVWLCYLFRPVVIWWQHLLRFVSIVLYSFWARSLSRCLGLYVWQLPHPTFVDVQYFLVGSTWVVRGSSVVQVPWLFRCYASLLEVLRVWGHSQLAL